MTAIRTETVVVTFKIETLETTFTSLGREHRVLIYGNEMTLFNGWISDSDLHELRNYGRIPRQR